MRITVPCPVCTQHLTFIATLPALGCPFCRATITFANGRVPVMEKVRCRRCGGVFTAEAPPTAIRVVASVPEPCPVCHVMLAVRKDLPPGKKVKCGQCGTKFLPPRDPAEQVKATPQVPAVKPVSKTELAPRKPASRTRLGPRQGGPRSSITHLAMDPLEETPQPLPAAPPPPAVFVPPPLGDDEIDLLSTDLGVDLEIPGEAPPKRLAKTPIETPKAGDPRPHPAAAPRPPHHPPMHAANGTTSPAADVRAEPEPVTKKKQRRVPAPPVKVRQAAPVEIEAGDVEVLNDESVAGPTTVRVETKRPEAPKPLSFQSAEREATSALLEDAPDEQPDELETDPAMPEGAQQLSQAQTVRHPLMPVAAPQPAAVISHRPKPADSPTMTIGGKKVLTYAGGVLVVAALVVGSILVFRPSRRLPVYKVEGVVFYQGEPAKDARVTLFPESTKQHRYFPSAKVGPDGKFELTTYAPGDGAPAGRYKVAIVRGQIDMQEYEELSKTKTPEEVRRISEERAQDPLYSQYANPSNSGLSAEIMAGKTNRLEYKLD